VVAATINQPPLSNHSWHHNRYREHAKEYESMRVLVVTAPFREHTYPLVPLAWELRTAGHEVLLATAGEAVRVADSGLPVADVARRFDLHRVMRRVAIRNPLLARAERAGRAGPRGLVTLFGEINDDLADGTVALAQEWRPQLVLYDALAPVGALVATRFQVPGVLCDSTLTDGQELSFATTGHLDYACGRHGVEAVAVPAAVIRLAPPSLVGDRPGWRMRCLPYDGGLAAPPWLDAPATRPRIAVVRSSPDDPDGAVMRAVVRAVRRATPGLDAELVLVRPDLGTGGPPLPDTIRTVEWAPLDRLLATCAGIVHHGGTATVLSALVHGVPQLLVPDASDRHHNAAVVSRRGIGLVCSRRELTGGLLRRLVTDPDLAATAIDVRTELVTAPHPSEIAARLADLVDSRQADPAPQPTR
jgi:UDP:flavonoid glycosyltransferase YjiC (YdhE family)